MPRVRECGPTRARGIFVFSANRVGYIFDRFPNGLARKKKNFLYIKRLSFQRNVPSSSHRGVQICLAGGTGGAASPARSSAAAAGIADLELCRDVASLQRDRERGPHDTFVNNIREQYSSRPFAVEVTDGGPSRRVSQPNTHEDGDRSQLSRPEGRGTTGEARIAAPRVSIPRLIRFRLPLQSRRRWMLRQAALVHKWPRGRRSACAPTSSLHDTPSPCAGGPKQIGCLGPINKRPILNSQRDMS